MKKKINKTMLAVALASSLLTTGLGTVQAFALTSPVSVTTVSSQDKYNYNLAINRLSSAYSNLQSVQNLNITTNGNALQNMTSAIQNAEQSITYATPYINKITDSKLRTTLNNLVTAIKNSENRTYFSIASAPLREDISALHNVMNLNVTTNGNALNQMNFTIQHAEQDIISATPYISKITDTAMKADLSRMISEIKYCENKANYSIASAILLNDVSALHNVMNLNITTNGNALSEINSTVQRAEQDLKTVSPYISKITDTAMKANVNKVIEEIRYCENQANYSVASAKLSNTIKGLNILMSKSSRTSTEVSLAIQNAEQSISFATPYISKVTDTNKKAELNSMISNIKHLEGRLSISVK